MTVPPQIEPAPDGGGLARSKASTRDLLPKADAPTGGNQRQVTLRYIDRPDCAETFADSIAHLSFDGQSLRIEFAATRMDDAKPDTPMTGRRYPACRLVLPPGAAIGAALTQAGVLRQNPPQATAGAEKPHTN